MCPDPGSFRDEHSRVHVGDRRVHRGLSAEAADQLRRVMDMPWYQRAVRGGAVIDSEWRSGPPDGVDEAWSAWLEHPRLPFVSYPFEWSFEMLRDAAKLQLELLAVGLENSVMCKDATPYNVQFLGSQPVFIDVGSFELAREGEPWYGYRQFCELFLYPLMFQAYKDLPFHPWLRGSVDGIEPDHARRVLSGRKRGRAGVLTHVELHARAEERYADREDDVQRDLKDSGLQRTMVEATIRKLARLVDGLEWRRSASEWSDYGERSHYSEEGLDQKEDFVRRVTGSRGRELVWDIGTNDGRFARIAAEHAEVVLAFDADHLVVDQLYRALRHERDRRILPLVVDVADIPGGLGWRGRERRVFTERGTPDLALCLAVVHHLAITANVPFTEIVGFLADNSSEAVVELPLPEDPKVRQLLRNKREGLHGGYTVEVFERVLEDRFEVRRREDLAGGTRRLYHVTRR